MAATLSALALALAAMIHCSAATTFTVGDSSGWTLPSDPSTYSNWAAGQKFTVGDILEFNFGSGRHDVTEVTKPDFDSCNPANPIAVHSSSPADITLSAAGDQYFFCSINNHCASGMKISITVTAAASPPPSPPVSSPPPPTPSTPASSPPPTTTPSPPPVTSSPPPTPSTAPPTESATPPPAASSPPPLAPAATPPLSPPSPSTSPVAKPPTPAAAPPVPMTTTPPTPALANEPTPPAAPSATATSLSGLFITLLSMAIALF